ncbi:MAG: hypothetical protein N3D84_03100, partial [Candidatus Woesearchaeota archaeon]|nr:hypothetical protein [Candidatus Woesearchaeota archaeon]
MKNKTNFGNKRMKKIAFAIFLFISISLSIPFCIAGTKTKGVEGWVYTPTGSPANHSSVRVHVTASAGIGATIQCTTAPPVYTDETGYYITNLANLRKDSDNSDCGDLWYSGDPIWAVVNGSTTIPIAYSDANSSASAIPDNSGATMRLGNVTLANTPPVIGFISAFPNIISGGNNTTIIPYGQNDTNRDNISLVCCFDITNSCIPTLLNNNCTGNWKNISYPYTDMNCTYTAPTLVDNVYYARCRLRDYQNYSNIVSASFIVDDIGPQTYDNFNYNNTWINYSPTITITPACGSTLCTWTHYCTENDSCYPHIDYSAPIYFPNENISYLLYHSNDSFGRVQDIVSKTIMVDKGVPLNENAKVTIENDSIYATSTTLNFNWSGFSDNLSGIKGYYYSFNNNQGTKLGTFDEESPGQLTGASQGLVYIYVWAIDNAENIGLAANDSIIVDSYGPTISLSLIHISEPTRP